MGRAHLRVEETLAWRLQWRYHFSMTRSFYLILAVLTGLACFCAGAQQKTIKKVEPIGAKSLDGKGLYQEFCAVCHGADLKGGGPAASALKQAPSDLTAIAKKNGGHFPDTKVMGILKGEESVSAHGTSDMPTWGKTFQNVSGNMTIAQGRMHALVNYLQEMQAK
jgi:mono/diheme cytochrome c family protein